MTKPSDDDAVLPLPPGLTARTVVLDDDEYLVIALPIPAWELPDCLTSAEREVATAVLRGLTNVEVARERGTSARTVANQLAHIFAKLGVKSRIELAHVLATRGKNYP